MFLNKRIWITGHAGMLGSAVIRCLANEEAQLLCTSRHELDLRDGAKVLAWMRERRPQLIFHIAAKVGGIQANAKMPADFLTDNILIQTNVMAAAHRTKVEKLVFVASNCIYPEQATQPVSEDALLTGMIEDNIRSYAISKIAGIEACRAFHRQYGCDFVSVVPPNLYGPGDNYNVENSHVVAGIMRRAHEAKLVDSDELVVWGDGTPRRELLHVDDVASALKCVMLAPSTYGLYNIGCGYDLTIAQIAQMIADTVGFKGKIVYDYSKPNGSMQKLLKNDRITGLGWRPAIKEAEGLATAYGDFLNLIEKGKKNTFQPDKSVDRYQA